MTDCLAWSEIPPRLVRSVRCVAGCVAVTSELAIRFDHGRLKRFCCSKAVRYDVRNNMTG